MTIRDKTYWTAGFLNERFPAPVSPLGWSVVGAQFEDYALRDPLRFMGYLGANQIIATRLLHGHPYSNISIFQILYNPFPDNLLPADAVRYFPGGAVEWRRRADYPRSIFNPRFLLSMLSFFMRDPINWSPFNFWQWSRHTHRNKKVVAELKNRLGHAQNPEEILEVIAGANRAHAELLWIHRWSLTYADILLKLLLMMVGDDALGLIADVPNKTQSLNQHLELLARKAGELGLGLETSEEISIALVHPEFRKALDEFLEKYGHRSFSLDIALPTFDEDPSQFLRLIHDHVGSQKDVLNIQVEGGSKKLPIYKRAILSLLLPLTRRYAALREDQRFYWQKSLAVTRQAYLKLGRLMRKDRWIEVEDDIMYATAAEVAGFFDSSIPRSEIARSIQLRREAWAEYRSEYMSSPAKSYPAFLIGDEPVETMASPRKDFWQGRGVSSGEARGKVRIVLDARDLARVAPGEILVAPATDPGWTPVFSRIAGLVVERGGMLAHSAIVAREHRLPAVAGISGITSELADGDLIQVDGRTGQVKRMKV